MGRIIETNRMTRIDVYGVPGRPGRVGIEQDNDTIIIDPAAVPALIEALQAAAKEAGNE